MKTITILYDSKYGHTGQMAQTMHDTLAGVDGIQVHLLNVNAVAKSWKLLSDSHGIIFGSPTFFGSVSAAFKQFMESSSIFFPQQKWSGKFAAGFTCSSGASGDKVTTLLQLFVFAAQHGMHWINLGLGNAGSTSDTENEANLNRLGCWMGAAGQPSPDRVPGVVKVSAADLGTARHLALRVANTVLRFS